MLSRDRASKYIVCSDWHSREPQNVSSFTQEFDSLDLMTRLRMCSEVYGSVFVSVSVCRLLRDHEVQSKSFYSQHCGFAK